MTTLETAARIQQRAVNLDPAKVLLFLAFAPFFLLGVTARLVWWPLAFAIAAAMDGWTQAGVYTQSATERLAARRSP